MIRKGNGVTVHETKAYGGRSTVPLILNLGNELSEVVTFKPRPPLPLGKHPVPIV